MVSWLYCIVCGGKRNLSEVISVFDVVEFACGSESESINETAPPRLYSGATAFALRKQVRGQVVRGLTSSHVLPVC